MSVLLPLLNKRTLVLLFFFCCSSVSAFTFGVSPPELSFEGDVGERLCDTLIISSTSPVSVTFSDAWSSTLDSRSLRDYTLSSLELALSPLYTQRVSFVGNTSVPVCITAQRAGTYSGLLLLIPTQGAGSIGIWLHVKSKGRLTSFFTGLSVAPLERTVSSLSTFPPVFLFLSTTALLLLVLGALLVLLFVRRRHPFTY